jgi:hypothetical protein
MLLYGDCDRSLDEGIEGVLEWWGCGLLVYRIYALDLPNLLLDNQMGHSDQMTVKCADFTAFSVGEKVTVSRPVTIQLLTLGVR